MLLFTQNGRVLPSSVAEGMVSVPALGTRAANATAIGTRAATTATGGAVSTGTTGSVQ